MVDTLDTERRAAVEWVAAALEDPYSCGPEPDTEELTWAAWSTLMWLYTVLKSTRPELMESMSSRVLSAMDTERSLAEAGMFRQHRFQRLTFSAGPRQPRVMVPPGHRPAGSTRLRATLAALALALFTALALIGAVVVALVIIGLRSGA